jgi:transposase
MKPNKSEISKIVLGRGYCLGECPFEAIEIDSTLSFKYFGGMYADQKGYYSGEIAQSYWDSLNLKINKIDLNKLDSVYYKTYDDQEVEFVIYKDGKRKYVIGQTDSLPLKLKDLLDLLHKIINNVDLKLLKDSINFETQVQYQYLRSTDSPKFLPKGYESQ